MMRRAFAVAIIVAFVVFVAIVVLAWVNPDFKATVDTNLQIIGGEMYVRLQGGWLTLMSMATVNGTAFLAYTLGIGIIFAVTWISFKKFLWDKHISPRISGSGGTKLPIVPDTPRDIIVTETPVPTTQKKEEVTPAESSSTGP